VAPHVGDAEAARRTLEQLELQAVLEARDRLAQARFRNAGRARGGGEAAVLGHGGEMGELVQIVHRLLFTQVDSLSMRTRFFACSFLRTIHSSKPGNERYDR